MNKLIQLQQVHVLNVCYTACLDQLSNISHTFSGRQNMKISDINDDDDDKMDLLIYISQLVHIMSAICSLF